ncbi:MAG: LacI family DNA-binding transcriptional regulator [Lachnospiraceae bacterium]
MAKHVTLVDIAKRVGVSNVAVSKALSGKPGVSDEMRKKIREVADELGYVPSSSSRSSAQKTGNIGVIVPEQYYGYSISFYGQLYEKVVKALYKNNYYGILELITAEAETQVEMPKVMQQKKVDGLIFLGQMKRDYIDCMVKQSTFPVMFLDTYLPDLSFDTVISDGYYGMYILTSYLIAKGHKQIAFVGSVDATSSIADRYWGYRRALRENGISYQEEWEIADRDEKGCSYEVLSLPEEHIDAYVCNCDFSAYILIQNLEEKKIRVPEDVSVVGFDNFLPIGIDYDRITSYEVNMERMAELCVQTLLAKIRKEPYVEGVQIVTGHILEKETVTDR